MSATRATRADLKRLPIGNPVASDWWAASPTICEAAYSVMKPAENSIVRV